MAVAPWYANQDCGVNECTPAAVSNSLFYLDSQQSLGKTGWDMGIEKMKEATSWDPDGCWINSGDDHNAWHEDKDNYMQANDYPVNTTTTNSMADVINACANGHDVELQGEWHTARVIGATDLGGGRYSMTIAHDTDQGNPGGTVTETIIYDSNTDTIEGSPGFFDGSSMEYAVIESYDDS